MVPIKPVEILYPYVAVRRFRDFPRGVDFAALDRAPVYTVVILLSSPAHPEEHLAAMEKVFRYLQRENFRRFLRQSETVDAIMDLVREADDYQET